jgi:tripartite-type tricarboxylate transporter receptor subunit TctC
MHAPITAAMTPMRTARSMARRAAWPASKMVAVMAPGPAASGASAHFHECRELGYRRREFHHQLIETHIMKLPRRQFLHLAAGAATLPAVSRFARAQTYPTRPVRIVVGFAPGGGADIFARLIGQWLSERLGQQFIVENRTGAATNIAAESVVRAAPDGYTLLLVHTTNASNSALYEKLSFNFARDVAPVAAFARVPNVLEVNPSVSAKTVPEFIALAKANPGKINMSSSGNGAADHLAAELFKMMAGVEIVQVQYRGAAPALTDLLGGQVQAMFSSVPSSIGYIRAGTLRPLAVTTASRSEALPDIPALGDFVPGYESSQWYGIGAPASTPASVIERLNKEINASLADPRIKAVLADQGGMALPGSSPDFGKLISSETEKWAKVVQAAKIRVD